MFKLKSVRLEVKKRGAEIKVFRSLDFYPLIFRLQPPTSNLTHS
jgi:hypothetical protein